MRRTLIIVAIVLVLGIGGYIAYLFLAGGSGAGVTTSGTPTFPNAGPGSAPSSGSGGGAVTATSATPSAQKISAKLVKVSAGPVVSGDIITDLSQATSSSGVVVHYIERESGNVYTYRTDAGVTARTSNKTVPGIQSATWLPDASVAFVRYLSGNDFSTINTYALQADGSEGFFLPQNLTDLAVSATHLLALASGVNGSVGSLERTDGTHASQAFTTPLSDVRVSFAGKSSYLAFTKPSATLPGDAYLVSSGGTFSRVAGPLNGLVALASPSGATVLVSYADSSGMHTELVNTKDDSVIPLPIATIADKCVWTADNSAIYCGVPVNPPAGVRYPDDWYQGAIHFSDRIWKIDVKGRYAQFVLDFNKETGEMLDAAALAVDPDATTLTFLNKNDGSLWLYRL